MAAPSLMLCSTQEPVTDKDLKKIRKEMQKIVRADMPFVKEEVSAAEARTRIKAQGEPYKLEILDSILARTPEAPITIYHIGEEGDPKRWWDLCAGPHVERTGDIAVDVSGSMHAMKGAGPGGGSGCGWTGPLQGRGQWVWVDRAFAREGTVGVDGQGLCKGGEGMRKGKMLRSKLQQRETGVSFRGERWE
eukprot:359137-Chlamydomonas_euryale.AAC.1